MNINTEYEKFTQEIYQILIEEEGVTIKVKHNSIVKGKAASHQIDVYWEYIIAGITHRVAIECKNYSSNVTIGKIRDFHGVLSDIGNINGIMVTKIGFQKGAKEFAEHYGINLMVLRKPIDSDWKGRVKIVALTVEIISTHITNTYIQVDESWAKEKFTESELKNFKLQITGPNNEIWIIDKNNIKIKNFLQLQDELPTDKEENIGLKHYLDFDDCYLQSRNQEKIKIKRIEFTYNINSVKRETIIDAQKTVKAILKNVLSGEIKFFDKKD